MRNVNEYITNPPSFRASSPSTQDNTRTSTAHLSRTEDLQISRSRVVLSAACVLKNHLPDFDREQLDLEPFDNVVDQTLSLPRDANIPRPSLSWQGMQGSSKDESSATQGPQERPPPDLSTSFSEQVLDPLLRSGPQEVMQTETPSEVPPSWRPGIESAQEARCHHDQPSSVSPGSRRRSGRQRNQPISGVLPIRKRKRMQDLDDGYVSDSENSQKTNTNDHVDAIMDSMSESSRNGYTGPSESISQSYERRRQSVRFSDPVHTIMVPTKRIPVLELPPPAMPVPPMHMFPLSSMRSSCSSHSQGNIGKKLQLPDREKDDLNRQQQIRRCNQLPSKYFLAQTSARIVEMVRRERAWALSFAALRVYVSSAFLAGKVIIIFQDEDSHDQLLGHAQMAGDFGTGLKPVWISDPDTPYFPICSLVQVQFRSPTVRKLIKASFPSGKPMQGFQELSEVNGATLTNMLGDGTD